MFEFVQNKKNIFENNKKKRKVSFFKMRNFFLCSSLDSEFITSNITI